MSRARLRKDDVIIEILHGWGQWRKNHGMMESNGERLPGAPGVHADPLFFEYVSTHASGNGLYAFIDRSVGEMNVPHQRIMLWRYVGGRMFTDIAARLKIEEHIARAMHNQSKDLLATGIVGYILVGRDREGTEFYRRDVQALA